MNISLQCDNGDIEFYEEGRVIFIPNSRIMKLTIEELEYVVEMYWHRFKKQNNWIDVKDKLPKVGENVIVRFNELERIAKYYDTHEVVCLSSTVVKKAGFYSVDYFPDDGNNEYSLYAVSDENNEENEPVVTQWCKIPE